MKTTVELLVPTGWHHLQGGWHIAWLAREVETDQRAELMVRAVAGADQLVRRLYDQAHELCGPCPGGGERLTAAGGAVEGDDDFAPVSDLARYDLAVVCARLGQRMAREEDRERLARLQSVWTYDSVFTVSDLSALVVLLSRVAIDAGLSLDEWIRASSDIRGHVE